MLVQSVLNQQQDDGQMTRRQVREILGVQIPAEVEQSQAMDDLLNNEKPAQTDQTIAKQNNHNVDRNKVQGEGKQAFQGQTPAGIIRQQAGNVAIGEDTNPMPQQQTQISRIQTDQTIPQTPEQIQGNKQQMSNQIQNIDDKTQPTARRQSQVERKLSNSRSQVIKTSVEDNLDQRQKEIKDMRDKNDRDWIGESLQSLQSTNIYQEVGLQQEAGRPGVDIIEQTFTDSDSITIQRDERSDKIQMPSARDQDILNFLTPDEDDPSSNSRNKIPQLSQQDRQAEKGYNKDLKVESVKKEDSTKPEKGQQIITQKQKTEIVNEVNKLRDISKKRLSENSKYKMFAQFVIKNFSSLNQHKINKLYDAMIKISEPKNLKEQYDRREKMLTENTLKNVPQKKLFQSNIGKFNKLRNDMLNNKAANVAQQSDPQNDRLRQLAGL